ncbi:nitroreductase family protein [Bacteroides coprosuis]|uniref:nitroreductase family protein n=1 Tax=Bacteroides coprosuis TaxID=151276 RepID=UPI001DC8D2D2|nr:nitroreductase family protein [Bacteroides coprosuis]HJD91732.1 nitroreductase family protein [Bacteroides coprosuis]
MIENKLWSAIENRRSIYSIDDKIELSNKEIKDLVDFAVKYVPSAFNNQSTRTVLLLGDEHKKLWDITKGILKEIVPADAFKNTEAKIDNSFRSGYGTILFYADDVATKNLMEQFPAYAANFPGWADQSSAMHQFAIWTMLTDKGLGVNLQHYNPLIDESVRKEWGIDENWRLIAQMPFGRPTGDAGAKEFKPVSERSIVFE